MYVLKAHQKTVQQNVLYKRTSWEFKIQISYFHTAPVEVSYMGSNYNCWVHFLHGEKVIDRVEINLSSSEMRA